MNQSLILDLLECVAHKERTPEFARSRHRFLVATFYNVTEIFAPARDRLIAPLVPGLAGL